jgi:hypothetical protein
MWTTQSYNKQQQPTIATTTNLRKLQALTHIQIVLTSLLFRFDINARRQMRGDEAEACIVQPQMYTDRSLPTHVTYNNNNNNNNNDDDDDDIQNNIPCCRRDLKCRPNK